MPWPLGWIVVNLIGIFASILKPRQNFDRKFNFYA